MLNHSLSLSSSITTMPAPSPYSNHHHQKPKKTSTNSNPNSTLLCKHSPSAILDILILILVLFSCTFLITSYFSYIFQSLSQILPSHSNSFKQSPFPYLLRFLIFFAVSVFMFEICCSYRSRKCENPGCRGLRKSMEFDIQLITEECLKSASKEIDNLPWRGGTEGNPDYECLRSELRRIAPPNGRAVLLFRSRCGCPIAKLEAWGPKRGRRHKKALNNLMLDGGEKDYH